VEAIIASLMKISPSPSTREIYQPLDIEGPWFSELAPSRRDSEARFRIMLEFTKRYVPVGGRKTYVDIGCNTGFHCIRLAKAGYEAIGVDWWREVIEVARLTNSFFHQTSVQYVCGDAIEYVSEHMEPTDVVSSFSAFQWMFGSHDTKKVYGALHKCMECTRRLFFFEIGYAEEEYYKKKALSSEPLSRDWCYEQLSKGRFDDVVLFEKGMQNLFRDVFVCVRR
jgi:SAM-dependent methyltransferase